LGLVRLGLVAGQGRLRVVVRRDRLHPVAPAGPAAEGGEVLIVVRVGRMRIAMRILAENLRRIVVHRLGSSLWVLLVRCMRAGSVHLLERKPNNEFSIPSALEWLLSVAISRLLASTSHRSGPTEHAVAEQEERKCTPSSSPNPANPR